MQYWLELPIIKFKVTCKFNQNKKCSTCTFIRKILRFISFVEKHIDLAFLLQNDVKSKHSPIKSLKKVLNLHKTWKAKYDFHVYMYYYTNFGIMWQRKTHSARIIKTTVYKWINGPSLNHVQKYYIIRNHNRHYKCSTRVRKKSILSISQTESLKANKSSYMVM